MRTQCGHTILLGGIGGDSHSVGLNILRQAISMNGYRLLYLGIQNPLEEFFRLAPLCNVAMVSVMDGHAQSYLRTFPELMQQYPARPCLWYLGGNLTIGDALGYEKYFLDLGFDRAAVKFIDVQSVLSFLEHDLHGVMPVPETPNVWELLHPQSLSLSAPVDDRQVDPQTFARTRLEVLEHWKTGWQARHLEANAEFLARQPSFPAIQALASSGHMPALVQPRSGVALVSEQIRLFKAFKSAGVRVLSYQVDSLTRDNNYVSVDEAIRESAASSSSTINGFPVVNHGVPALRQIVSEVGVPLQTRHSTRDPRLLAEISYAGGVTAFEGGSICYNIPYYRDYPLHESINTWQYVDRLTGIYFDRFGIVLDREFFGTLTATLIPPCLAIVTNLVEAILAVQQGVKCVSLAYAEQGHRIQDIAAIRVLGDMAKDILHNLGYTNVQINTVFHQYMAAFPPQPQRAEVLIRHSATTAALAGVPRMLIKTPVEAYKIPAMHDNLNGLSLVRQGLERAIDTPVDKDRVEEEARIIRREVQAILDSLFLCGQSSLAQGVITGFREGFLDIPFSPSIHNKGAVVTARDIEGAVRFLSTGHLQFDRELRDFHRDKMQDRLRAEGVRYEKQSYLLIERDVLRIARGDYQSWPLFG